MGTLVKSAKILHAAVADQPDLEFDGVVLDDLVMKALRMVISAIDFLDIWEADVAVIDCANARNTAMSRPHAQSNFNNPGDAAASGDVVSSLHEQSAHVADATRQDVIESSHDNGVDLKHNAFARRRKSSQTLFQSTSPFHDHQSPRTRQKQAGSRLSYRISQTPASVTTLASQQLVQTHDTFLGFLGTFIGLHLQSRSSSELFKTTQQSISSCRTMLQVVDAIWERDLKRSDPLAEARDVMLSRLAGLGDAANKMFGPDRRTENDHIVFADGGKPLVDAATACVRAAGDCVAESRFVLERLGDFDFGPLGLGIKVASEGPLFCEKPVPDDSVPYTEPPIPPQPISKPPPPPPPVENDVVSDTSQPEYYADKGSSSSSTTVKGSLPAEGFTVDTILPPLPSFNGLRLSNDEPCPSPQSSFASSTDGANEREGRLRGTSLDDSSMGGSSAYIGGMRDSETNLSESSTRATSPDIGASLIMTTKRVHENPNTSFSTFNDDCEEAEAAILQKTYAHQLIHNKQGQISGGTLPALIECLTTHDSAPDATFVSTFYLTFRLFATPDAFAHALIDRFQYVGEYPCISGPVRLRVYNIFKGWLESHWRQDCDAPALEAVRAFANGQLQDVIPAAGKRLAVLASKVSNVDGPLVPRLVSSIGKTNTSIATYISPDAPLPTPIVSRAQYSALKNWKNGVGAPITILDFDPMELARQFTIKASGIFCSILPEELLATEWMKKTGSKAVNVRAMSRLSTDLANLVSDCILQLEDPKRRAVVIKQWVKIASRCLEIANYDSMMAIVCSLNSSIIIRLKRTWEIVSSKTKATLDSLKQIIDCSKNYTVLRQRLQNTVPPCLPYVGTYLTDLTFVDVGNQTTRQLQINGTEDSVPVINFDKHMKTAKIISDLQRFQIPYRFAEIPELQTWIQDQLIRVRSTEAGNGNVQNHYRRSLLLEPRDRQQQQGHQASFLKGVPSLETKTPQVPSLTNRERFGLLQWGSKTSSGTTTPKTT